MIKTIVLLAAWICQQIMAIYLEKIQDDEERMAMGIAKLSLPLHVYNYFLKHFGLSAAADVQVALMLKACEVHVRSLPRVALYVSQLGLFDKEKPPPLDVRDTDFILHFLKELIRNGELVQDHGKKSIVKRVNVIKPEVSRVAAANAISSIFEKWLPDKGEEFVIKVKSVNNGDKGSKYIDLDFVLDMLMEPWTNIRLQWEEHARYLFHEFCGVYKVLQEVTFANDEGVKPSDAILGEVHKASAMDCIRRPMRTFQKGETKEEDSTGKSGQDQKKPKVVVGNPNKEPVCEAMNKKSFINVMHTINPSMPMKKVY